MTTKLIISLSIILLGLSSCNLTEQEFLKKDIYKSEYEQYLEAYVDEDELPKIESDDSDDIEEVAFEQNNEVLLAEKDIDLPVIQKELIEDKKMEQVFEKSIDEILIEKKDIEEIAEKSLDESFIEEKEIQNVADKEENDEHKDRDCKHEGFKPNKPQAHSDLEGKEFFVEHHSLPGEFDDLGLELPPVQKPEEGPGCNVLLSPEKELIVNGSFELGHNLKKSENASGWSVYESILGWNTDREQADAPIEIQYGHIAGLMASDGKSKLELDSHDKKGFSESDAVVYQDIQTEKGKLYILSLDYSARTSNDIHSNAVDVYFSGKLVAKLESLEGKKWKRFHFSIEGIGGVERLELKARKDRDTKGGFIDNVSMKALAPIELAQCEHRDEDDSLLPPRDVIQEDF